ncbi:MAG TPA: hypothetical protein VFI23_06675 [Rhizomicrobium sp.]|nr:hypothetical protein [Rhizomicrobium sp.]
MKQGIWAILALSLLMAPAFAAENAGPPFAYHDCRPSEDIVNGRAVHRTVCQNADGAWVEVRPEKRPAPPRPAATPANAVKRPVYHDCRPSEDIIGGRRVHKIVCQNEAGAWVEVLPEDLRP